MSDPAAGPWVQCLPTGDQAVAVSPEMICGAAGHLRSRGPQLRALWTEQVASRLGAVHERLLADEGGLLSRWCHALSADAGLSEAMCTWALRDLLRRLTPRALVALMEAEFGHRDPFQAPRMSLAHACARGAVPPPLLFCVLSGNIPTVAVEAIALALLARAPIVVKTSRQDPHSARCYLEALRRWAPDLAAHVAVLTWTGGDETIETRACAEASVVIAYGDNHTIDAMYQRCRFPTKFVGYGHRVSFGVMGPWGEGEGPTDLDTLARDWALDVAAFDQLGCMSLQCLFVHRQLPWSPEEVAGAVARGLDEVARDLPRGRMTAEVLAAQMQWKGRGEFGGTVLEASQGAVIAWRDEGFRPSPGGRLLHVVPWEDEGALVQALQPLCGALSTAGLWCATADRASLITRLMHLGVRRVVRPGRMQRPLWLRDHDGRPRMADWVDWTDVEL
jgi:hypothetical protein